jgi:hypothetical protein
MTTTDNTSTDPKIAATERLYARPRRPRPRLGPPPTLHELGRVHDHGSSRPHGVSTTTPTAHTDHSISTRPQATLAHALARPSGHCDETASAVSYTSMCRSHYVTELSAPTGRERPTGTKRFGFIDWGPVNREAAANPATARRRRHPAAVRLLHRDAADDSARPRAVDRGQNRSRDQGPPLQPILALENNLQNRGGNDHDQY